MTLSSRFFRAAHACYIGRQVLRQMVLVLRTWGAIKGGVCMLGTQAVVEVR